jgi:exodeoxyribonuclease III
LLNIISYNVNGIRSAVGKGFWEWLALEQPDVICLQEIKALQSDLDLAPLEALGYQHYWHSAEKKGYSGTATFSKQPATLVNAVSGMAEYDREGRILRTDFGDWTLLNCYFPSGSSGDDRQAFKMQFLGDFDRWIADLKQERPNIIIVGDYNIAHAEMDIHDPKGNKNSSGFLPEEREWMTRFLSEGGFSDAFRQVNPALQMYSWWSFRFNARTNNKGWRIDYQCATSELASALTAAELLNEVKHSDHCPVKAIYNIKFP